MDNILYIDICDNLKFFFRLQNTKPIKSKIKRLFKRIQFSIYTRFNILKKVKYRRKDYMIIFTKKNENSLKLNQKIDRIMILNRRKKIVLSEELYNRIKDSKYYTLKDYKEWRKKNKESYIKNLQKVILHTLYLSGKRIEETNIYILSKVHHFEYRENIINLAKICRSINIITNEIDNFKEMEDYIENVLGIPITVSNNKNKGLVKSKYIINIDYNEEDLRQYNIRRDAIIFNVSNNTLNNIGIFDGIIINNVAFYQEDRALSRFMERRFGELYGEKYRIIDLIGNNGSVLIKNY